MDDDSALDSLIDMIIELLQEDPNIPDELLAEITDFITYLSERQQQVQQQPPEAPTTQPLVDDDSASERQQQVQQQPPEAPTTQPLVDDDSALDSLIDMIIELLQEDPNIPDELLAEITDFNTYLSERQQQVQQQPPEAPTTQPLDDETELLWALSGRQPESFIQYLRNYPNAEMQQLLRDPERLQQVIQQLQHRSPIEAIPQQQADGIPKAQLQSSNVFGAKYDPESSKMFVRFQSGSVYSYDNVPPYVFNAFKSGAAECKTSGRNRFGRWWKAKQPSLGASLNEYIKKAGYNYKRLK